MWLLALEDEVGYGCSHTPICVSVSIELVGLTAA